MSKYVLDASALLALLNEEEGNKRVEAILGEAVVSAVNAGETLGNLIDAGVRKGMRGPASNCSTWK